MVRSVGGKAEFQGGKLKVLSLATTSVGMHSLPTYRHSPLSKSWTSKQRKQATLV